jgi:hypothetical protein
VTVRQWAAAERRLLIRLERGTPAARSDAPVTKKAA